jgi:glycosyltransferase involved in cell wall biosynthesis
MLRDLAPELVTRGIETGICFPREGPLQREMAANGAETAIVRWPRLLDLRAGVRGLAGLARYLRAAEPDVVVHWTTKSQVQGALAAALTGLSRRSLWWQHGFPTSQPIDRLAMALPAQAIGCSSRYTERAQRAASPHRSTFVVHPGIQPRERSSEAARAKWRRRLDLPPEGLVFGLVGRLQPWKGQDRFLQALAMLRREGCDVHGLLIGGDSYGLSSDYAASIPAHVSQLGLTGHVTLTGHLDDAWQAMGAMDVLVNASEGEPFGIVLVEAMCEALPVIASRRGGPAEIVLDGETGILTPSAEPTDLARAMRELIQHPERRRTMGEAGRARMKQLFSTPHMADEFLLQVGEALSTS